MLESVKTLFDDTETMDYGSKLARCFSDSPADSSVIYLKGDLGAGKTTFAKGFLRGMGYEGNVTSPTYTLIELYRTEVYDIYHV
ncbi:MAG TPA: tRNA (adenosine(37)-N6)-threonylcarbamoyltransferase complex ATPase subunit type 1 TsaE, partial [Gammaproteobacteria bacterium]|nr:tRNA (adenosine(37)-N6)-threonylcarbamoyltransferase complex ATPase subunit type 1 TsaE [Gammaproteobacteria bacterium]